MKKIICQILFMLSFSAAKAQQIENKFNNLYVNVEFGASDGYQLFIQMGLSLQIKRDYWKIRVASAFDHLSEVRQAALKANKDCDCNEFRQMEDVGLIYGKSFGFLKRNIVQVGTGISYIARREPDELFNATKQPYEFDRFSKKETVGLPLEVRYLFQINRHFAITGTGYANLNGLKSLTGVSGGIAWGFF